MNRMAGRKHGRARRAVLGLLALLLLSSEAFGQDLRPPSTPVDPVERLRLTLQEAPGDATARDQNLRQCVDALRGVGELRRALMLREWKDQSLDSDVAAVDRARRKTLTDRFVAATRDMLEAKDSTVIYLALDLLVETAAAARESAEASTLLPYFTQDVLALVKDGEPRVRLAAARALGAIEPELSVAVPVLADLFVSTDANLRRGAADGLTGLLEAALQSPYRPGDGPPNPAGRREAVQAAATILPAFRAGYGDNQVEVRRRCLAALLRTTVLGCQLATDPTGRDGADPTEIDYLRRQLETERTDLRPLLLCLGAQTPHLTRAAKDGDAEVRLAALAALEALANLRRRWVRQGQWLAAPDKPPLVEDPLGDRLSAALPALATALTDQEVRVRRAALDVLEVLGPLAAPAAPAVARVLRDSDRFARWSAVRTLDAIGSPGARPAIPALARLLDDPDPDIDKAVIDALVRLDPAGRGAPPGKHRPVNAAPRNAVPALIHVMQGHDPETCVAAIRAVRGMGPNARPAVAALSAALGDADARVRRAAAETLGELGNVARDAVPDLSLTVKDPDANVRRAAHDALLRIARAAQP